ncbi:hypothetical protein [Vibrio algicola]|uniref:CG2 omega domain protein n=1 Tax=Vibrio algicola TaxID=2662262 RepID=A0A5Q0TMW0_9VIBR|nr:hypothetical protein [Vibrio algicola]
MKIKALVMLGFALASSMSYAGVIKPDCNASKAAKNAALESSVGVNGRCDVEKTTKQAKKEVTNKVDDTKDAVSDKVDDTKDNVSDKVDDTKDNVSGKVDDVKDAPAKSMVKAVK